MVPFLNQESSEKRSAYLFSLTTTTLLHNHPLQREREREILLLEPYNAGLP